MLMVFPIVSVVDAAPRVLPVIVAVIVEYPAPPAGAEIVIVPFDAPTDTAPAPEILNTFENVPDELSVVLPSAVTDTVEVCTDAEIVIVDNACPIPIPAPAEIDIELIEPLSALTTEALLPEIINEPMPAPTDMSPAPSIVSALFIVPDDVAPVVFPVAYRDTVENKFGELLEIVIVLAFVLSEIPGPATRLTLFVMLFTEYDPPPADPIIVMVEALLLKLMFAPATRLTEPVLALSVNAAPPPPDPGTVTLMTLMRGAGITGSSGFARSCKRSIQNFEWWY